MKQRRIVFTFAAGFLLLALGAQPVACRAQTASPNLPPGVQDVVRLVKAGLNEEVVKAQIKHVGATYPLTADQIIYLHDQGVSQTEIAALMGSGTSATPTVPAPMTATPNPPPATAAAPSPQLAPPPDASSAPPTLGTVPGLDSFQAQLAPYGAWMEVPGYGLCWRPSVEAVDPDWRPYFDGGYWAYTADGWSWVSDYPWGDVAFHYGRWYRDNLGWMWVPGYDWAPAWVCWRQADGYCGWAPLPPGAVFRRGVGLWYGGRLAVDVDFGLGPDAFVFVGYDHFWDHHLHGYLLPRARLAFEFRRSVIMNGYRVDHGRFVVEGLGREHMAAMTHRDIVVERRPGRDFGSRGRVENSHRGYSDDRKGRSDH
ncbi:MAG TPA: DUF6600 domain-containing protein [Verrucomicrobiae bacterium]|nr:DUF6600 domain-containing protein [Verrucomicrobiae bacterium]